MSIGFVTTTKLTYSPDTSRKLRRYNYLDAKSILPYFMNCKTYIRVILAESSRNVLPRTFLPTNAYFHYFVRK